MKCAFCATVWRTRKARGTRAVFSLKATLFWLIWLGTLVFGAVKAVDYWNAASQTDPNAETPVVPTDNPTGDGSNGEASSTETDVAEPINNGETETNEPQNESFSENVAPSSNDSPLKYQDADDLDFRSFPNRANDASDSNE